MLLSLLHGGSGWGGASLPNDDGLASLIGDRFRELKVHLAPGGVVDLDTALTHLDEFDRATLEGNGAAIDSLCNEEKSLSEKQNALRLWALAAGLLWVGSLGAVVAISAAGVGGMFGASHARYAVIDFLLNLIFGAGIAHFFLSREIRDYREKRKRNAYLLKEFNRDFEKLGFWYRSPVAGMPALVGRFKASPPMRDVKP